MMEKSRSVELTVSNDMELTAIIKIAIKTARISEKILMMSTAEVEKLESFDNYHSTFINQLDKFADAIGLPRKNI